MTGIRRIEPLEFPWQTPDPFLFCAYHNDLYPPGNGRLGPNADLSGRDIGMDFSRRDGWSMYHGESVPGFPAHPHCGFETITIVEKGITDHADSLGAAGRFGQGDVQWMTAGKGIQHSEMFPLLDTDNRNPLLLFQIWLNLPRRSKKVDPFYRMLWHEDIPVYSDTQVRVKIIAGSFGGQSALPPPPASWASNSDNHVGIHLITLAAGGKVELPRVGPGVNRSLYYYAGDEIRVNQKDVAAGSRIDLDGTTVAALQANGEDARILVLQGRPVGDPVVQHGPFVVNEREELHEVYRDFQQSQFGGWPWKDRGQVHGPSRGRFARHADGTIESRD